MVGLFLNLFDDLYHDESRADVLVLVSLKIHELFQGHLGLVFGGFLTVFRRRTLFGGRVIVSALKTAWTDVFSLDG